MLYKLFYASLYNPDKFSVSVHKPQFCEMYRNFPVYNFVKCIESKRFNFKNKMFHDVPFKVSESNFSKILDVAEMASVVPLVQYPAYI